MSDDFTSKIITQITENIQKLFDFSSRVDERLKSLQSFKEDFENHKKENAPLLTDIDKEISILKEETKKFDTILNKLSEIEVNISKLDQRVVKNETSIQGSQNRTEKVASFFIQIVWVVLAAWLLSSLGLESLP
jgi:uncharacterized phage infection (PIP) family protein YhgE